MTEALELRLTRMSTGTRFSDHRVSPRYAHAHAPGPRRASRTDGNRRRGRGEGRGCPRWRPRGTQSGRSGGGEGGSAGRCFGGERCPHARRQRADRRRSARRGADLWVLTWALPSAPTCRPTWSRFRPDRPRRCAAARHETPRSGVARSLTTIRHCSRPRQTQTVRASAREGAGGTEQARGPVACAPPTCRWSRRHEHS